MFLLLPASLYSQYRFALFLILHVPGTAYYPLKDSVETSFVIMLLRLQALVTRAPEWISDSRLRKNQHGEVPGNGFHIAREDSDQSPLEYE